MFVRGELQRRQLEGKKVENRLSATPLNKGARIDTSELSRGSTLLPVARIGSPLLLKTNLPRPPDHAQAASAANLTQYSGRQSPRQRLKPRQLHFVPIWPHAALLPGRISSAPSAGSSRRTAPAEAAISVTKTFR